MEHVPCLHKKQSVLNTHQSNNIDTIKSTNNSNTHESYLLVSALSELKEITTKKSPVYDGGKQGSIKN